MRKDKRYTRAELESVRRADLQSLYKSHNLKGANKSTQQLIEELLELFASPKFASSSSDNAKGGSGAGTRRPAPPPKGVSKSHIGNGNGNGNGATRPGTARSASRAGQPYPKKARSHAGNGVNEPAKAVGAGGTMARATPVRGRRASRDGLRKIDGSRNRAQVDQGSVEGTPIDVDEIMSTSTAPITVTEIPLADATANTEPVHAVASGSQSNTLSSTNQQQHLLDSLSSLEERLQKLEVQNVALQQALEAKDHSWEESMKQAEERWDEKLRSELRGLEVRFLTAAHLPPTAVAGPSKAKTVTFQGDDGFRKEQGNRPARQSAQGRTKRPATLDAPIDEDSESKRPRLEAGPAAEERSAKAISPVTPPPSHQGIPVDNSRTPIVDPDYFADAPSFTHSTGRPGHRPRPSLSDSNDLPYPFFATTPKPSEPRSPTTDAPPSASRHRTTLPSKAVLTPGRSGKRPGDAPVSTSRAVSDAHKELSTITEETQDPGASSTTAAARAFGLTGRLGGPSLASSSSFGHRRRVSSAESTTGQGHGIVSGNTPAKLFGPALARGGSVPISPPRLSPSPSIGDKDGFTYTPFPPVPTQRASSLSRSISRPRSQDQDQDQGQDHGNRTTDHQSVAAAPPRTPPRQTSLLRSSSPPTSEYMDVALQRGPSDATDNNLALRRDSMDTQSPSASGAFATPGHRTLLGTETYRDTRFGDVPSFNWGTPSVDLGTGGTPRNSMP